MTTFDPYLKWLGIREPERPPNHYRLLGLALFENDREVIEAAAQRQVTFLESLQGDGKAEQKTIASLAKEVKVARSCLLSLKSKRIYDEELRRIVANQRSREQGGLSRVELARSKIVGEQTHEDQANRKQLVALPPQGLRPTDVASDQASKNSCSPPPELETVPDALVEIVRHSDNAHPVTVVSLDLVSRDQSSSDQANEPHPNSSEPETTPKEKVDRTLLAVGAIVGVIVSFLFLLGVLAASNAIMPETEIAKGLPDATKDTEPSNGVGGIDPENSDNQNSKDKAAEEKAAEKVEEDSANNLANLDQPLVEEMPADDEPEEEPKHTQFQSPFAQRFEPEAAPKKTARRRTKITNPVSPVDVAFMSPTPDLDGDAFKRSRKLFASTFGDDFDKAQTTSEKLDVVRGILREADATKKDLVGKYVMLNEAATLSAKAGDIYLALQAYDTLNRTFQNFDYWPMVELAMSKSAKNCNTEPQAKALVDAIYKLTDQLEAESKFEIAEELVGSARTAISKFESTKAHRNNFDRLNERFRLAKSLEENGETAKAILAKDREHSQSHIARGEQLIFLKGDLITGLEHWRHCKSEVHNELSRLERLRLKRTPEQTFKLGQLWEKVGQAFTPDSIVAEFTNKKSLGYYRDCVGKLATDKNDLLAKNTKRLDVIATSNLLHSLNIERDFLVQFTGSNLQAKACTWLTSESNKPLKPYKESEEFQIKLADNYTELHRTKVKAQAIYVCPNLPLTRGSKISITFTGDAMPENIDLKQRVMPYVGIRDREGHTMSLTSLGTNRPGVYRILISFDEDQIRYATVTPITKDQQINVKQKSMRLIDRSMKGPIFLHFYMSKSSAITIKEINAG